MKNYNFEKRCTRVLNSKVWDCTLDGDVSAVNAVSFKKCFHELVDSWNTEVNLTITPKAKFDLSAMNALVTGYRKAAIRGNSLKINIDDNPGLMRMLAQSKFDSIILN